MKRVLTSRVEDYLRVIYEIIREKGYARIRDIAREIGVQPSSAVEMIKKLDQLGLVVYEKYGAIVLTSEGKEIAWAIEERHDTFMKLLELIHVPKDIALKDAHVLEHQLHPKTILQFRSFVKFVTGDSEHSEFARSCLEKFREYCEKDASSMLDHNK